MTTLLTFEGPFGTIPGFSIVCCDSDNGGGSGCCDIDGVIPDGSVFLMLYDEMYDWFGYLYRNYVK